MIFNLIRQFYKVLRSESKLKKPDPRQISHNKSPVMKQDRHKSDSYKPYLQYLVLTVFICFSVEPAINLFTFLGNHRRPQTEDWIFYAYKIKTDYAIKVPKRKILIVAGSSSLFGISAEQIQSTTSIPTVNFGVHAGLGTEYILHKAKNSLKPGDIVLIALEFPLYHIKKDDINMNNNTLRNYLISYDHDYFEQLSLVEKIKALFYSNGLTPEFIYMLRRSVEDPSFITFDKRVIYNRFSRVLTGKENCYSETSFNNNGDQKCNIGNLPNKNLVAEIDPNPKEPIDPSNSIKDFCIFAKNNKITVIPLYPTALFRSKYKSDKYKDYFSKIEQFWNQQGLLFEDSINNSLLEVDLMFDNAWHPNDKGRNLRTRKIINILKKHLEKPL